MKYLEQFSLKRIFDFSFVVAITGNIDLASSTVQNYLSKGYIKRVKKNLYVAISLETGGSIPSKFEMASNITKSSFLSYNSAFEFYGYQNQVYNEIYVSSLEQFHSFIFEHYKFVCKRVKDIDFVNTVNGIRVSTIEKSIVDSIDIIKTFDDFEELFEVLSMIPLIDGSKILAYLKHVNKRILYSKTGLILSFFKDDYNITTNHLEEMKENGIKNANYFTNEKHRLNKYYSNWKLYSYDISKIKMVKMRTYDLIEINKTSEERKLKLAMGINSLGGVEIKDDFKKIINLYAKGDIDYEVALYAIKKKLQK